MKRKIDLQEGVHITEITFIQGSWRRFLGQVVLEVMLYTKVKNKGFKERKEDVQMYSGFMEIEDGTINDAYGNEYGFSDALKNLIREEWLKVKKEFTKGGTSK